MRAHCFHAGWMGMAAAGGLLLAACAPSTTATPPPAPTSAETVARSDVVSASVRVEPSRSADLGFLVSAPVKQVLVHEGDAVEAGQAVIILDAPQLDLAVEAAEQALIAAQRNEFIQSQGRRKWDGFKFVWVAGPPEQRTGAHARVLQAQAGLDAAQAELERSILRSPFDGTIVSIRVQPGEVVEPGQLAATVGDLKHLRLETTDLSERDVARLSLGQSARVTLEAIDDLLNGSVVMISPLAGKSPDGDVIYAVTIDLASPPPQLLWGMTGTAEIRIDS